MGTVEEAEPPLSQSQPPPKLDDYDDDDEISPIEQVRLTVPITDDPTLPVWTFRMWALGLLSCVLLSFLNQFFSYRRSPLVITQITVLVATLPIGRFMAAVLPSTKWTVSIPGLGPREFSLNPGPFNIKEHVLISIFANAGSAFGNGPAYAVMIVDIIIAFYGRKISFLAGWLLIITTQVLGYGWAGLLRKYVVDPAHMWWPSTLVQISLFRTLHEKDEKADEGAKKQMSRSKFFLIALTCSFLWYLFPGYLFKTLQSISWLCWAFPHSVTAQQLGSGFNGLAIGALTLDWSVVASFLFSPLISPFFAIANIFVGYFVIMYVVVPISYWGLNVYNAKTFPLYSVDLFTADGQDYDIKAIVNNNFKLDKAQYAKQGRIHLSIMFALAYGFGFATIAATISHVALFYGKEIYERFKASKKGKIDIHTRLMMKNYQDIPSWWFYILLAVTLVVALMLCIFMKDEVQMPVWALVLSAVLAFSFTLPISIITATTNQTPGLNIITEYLMGVIYPGRPIANVCFKVYGYMSMSQAVAFLSDFKLGHYMKIPPRSMFLVQFIGTMVAGTVNMSVAWWMLHSIEGICHQDPDSSSPWTCTNDHVFFDASVIWGLVSPIRIFGSQGNYPALNWFFLVGLMGPVVVWGFHRAFPQQSWIPLINLPVLLGATANLPPASALNYNAWIFVGTVFNFFVFRYRKKWWQRYNYILSAALDAGVAFMAVLLYFSTGIENKSVTWWGNEGEHCGLAICPTAKGVVVENCPVF
ncbi:oligopeptide transporter 4-like [Salvia miltiorrhiza]|uniref:oligopeptide transporter 4-like n=1 Tax=Salvia miltiorrhiza TaxID=226208 RepID=UPI0025AC16FB|nr:oligopeptide transporter 4-like [Salvia miltiorrhiza]